MGYLNFPPAPAVCTCIGSDEARWKMCVLPVVSSLASTTNE